MKIIVNPHKLEIAKSPVNEKEINVTECEFEFADEITDNYVKEAYFTFKGNTYKQIIVNNQCSFPSEVLEEKGQVEIGVVAYIVENGEELKRYNPSPAYFNTWLGSLKEEYENTEPITPTDLEQLQSVVAGKQDRLVSGTNIKTINNESLLGSGNINIQGGSGGSSDYEDLENKPLINNVELIRNKSLADLGIQPSGDYALSSDIPTTLAELADDSTHRVVTDTEKATWNNKSDFSGSYTDLTDKPTLFSGDYNDLTNKPTIPTVPTNVSSFTNDSGYLVSGDLKTINGNSIVGSGDITISGGYSNYAIPTYCLRTATRFSSETQYTGSNFSSTDRQKISDIITDAYANGYFNFSLILSYENSGNYSYGFSPFFLATMGSILNKGTNINFFSNALVQNRYIKNDTRHYNSALISIDGSWNGDVFTATSIKFYNKIYDMLTLDNERSYTPTSDYHPSTKKYVDDSIASAITTTLGGSY